MRSAPSSYAFRSTSRRRSLVHQPHEAASRSLARDARSARTRRAAPASDPRLRALHVRPRRAVPLLSPRWREERAAWSRRSEVRPVRRFEEERAGRRPVALEFRSSCAVRTAIRSRRARLFLATARTTPENRRARARRDESNCVTALTKKRGAELIRVSHVHDVHAVDVETRRAVVERARSCTTCCG